MIVSMRWLLTVALAMSPAIAPPACPAGTRTVPADPRLAQAHDLADRSRYAEAESLAGAVLADIARQKDPAAAASLAALDELTYILVRGPRSGTDSALGLAKRAVDAHLALPGDAAGLAAGLLRLATVYQKRSVLDSAVVAVERGWDVARRARPTVPDLEAKLLMRFAEIEVGQNDFAQARQHARAAVAKLDSVSGVDSLTVAGAQGILGKVLLRFGDQRDDARRNLESCLALRERIQGADHPDLIAPLMQLATSYGLAGEIPRSIQAMDRAIALCEKYLASDVRLLGSVYTQGASIHRQNDDYPEAARLARLGLAARERDYGLSHPLTASSVIALGVAVGHLGDFENALKLMNRGVAIQRAALPADSPDLAYGLGELASVHLARHEWTEARDLFQEATAIREKNSGPDNISLAFTLGGLAATQQALGDWAGATPTLERVARIQAGKDPGSLAVTLGDLAMAYLHDGRPDQSVATINRAVAHSDSVLGPGAERTQQIIRVRSSILYRLGKRRDALAGALAMERNERERLRLTAAHVSEREAMSSVAVRANGIDFGLEMASDSLGLASEQLRRLWDELVRSRALVFDVLSERRRILRDAGGEFRDLEARLDTARTSLSEALVQPRPTRESVAWQNNVDSLRAGMEAAERLLGERSAPFLASRRRSDVGFAEVRRSLPPDAALVSFVRFTARDRPGAGGSGEGEDEYAALVTGSASPDPHLVRLGRAAQLEPRLDRWLALLGTPPPRDRARARVVESDVERAGRSVRRAVWDPLVPWLGQATRVFLVPDGRLQLANLAALPVSGGHFLAEQNPVLATLSTERDLIPLKRTSTNHGLLVVGAPDFDATTHGAPDAGVTAVATNSLAAFRSAIPEPLRLRFPPLPASGAEANEVALSWRTAGGSDTAAVVLTGDAATETAFERAASGSRVLHLATHGFVLGVAPGVADGAGSPNTRGVGGVVGEGLPVIARQPGSASLSVYGLAMSGANRASATASGTDDGFLTGEEISGLDFDGTEWAVLSACRTGAADTDQPDCLQGLHRAFRLAGVKTVVMSLWPVDDDATRQWMEALYHARLVDHAHAAEAVQSAERVILAMRRSRGESTHPFYWAAFIAAGSPH